MSESSEWERGKYALSHEDKGMCERAGLGVIDDGTLPQEPQFNALCTCGRMVAVTSGQIEWHETPAPWDRPDGCFGHCDKEGWFAPCSQPHQQFSRDNSPGVAAWLDALTEVFAERDADVAQNTQPTEPTPCDHGAYWTDHGGRNHCLVCPHVSDSTVSEDDRG